MYQKLFITFLLLNPLIMINNNLESYINPASQNLNNSEIVYNKICYSIQDFNNRKSMEKTGYTTLEDAIKNATFKASGSFGIVKTLNYGGKEISVKIQNFENFDINDIEFWAINNELKNIYLINQSVEKNKQKIVQLENQNKIEEAEKYLKFINKLMVVNFYGCVYDTYKKVIYLFIDNLYDTILNQRENFLKLDSYERYVKYRILIYDLRKIHLQTGKVHLDIKPDNIMITKSLLRSKNDESQSARMKFIDYGLMSSIGSKIRVFNRDYAHPDLINNDNEFAYPYLDIYSLLLTFAEIEYGIDFIRADDDCYKPYNFTEECFQTLKLNIVLGHCVKMKTENSKINCGYDFKEYLKTYIPDPVCKDLACFIYKTLKYDGKEMQAHLDSENKAKNENITVNDFDSVIDACPNNQLNIFINAFNKISAENSNRYKNII